MASRNCFLKDILREIIKIAENRKTGRKKTHPVPAARAMYVNAT